MAKKNAQTFEHPLGILEAAYSILGEMVLTYLPGQESDDFEYSSDQGRARMQHHSPVSTLNFSMVLVNKDY